MCERDVIGTRVASAFFINSVVVVGQTDSDWRSNDMLVVHIGQDPVNYMDAE